MNKKNIILLLVVIFYSSLMNAQSIKGNLKQLSNQTIQLEGFNGFNTYTISLSTVDERGNFKLNYSKADYGMGYLISTDKKIFFLVLSDEDIDLVGDSLNDSKSIKVTKSIENQWFEQYANEHPKREQALAAWDYLEKMYQQDVLFSGQKGPNETIQHEKKRINKEDDTFLNSLPKESFCNLYLPIRKLVSSVSTIAKYRTQEIPATIEAFRKIDYTDNRLYKSGIVKDVIESHFWLIENSGKPLDSVFIEMKCSIDIMIVNLVRDNVKLNEVTNFLFDLLEKHSLFSASEYLALKVLNQTSCTIDSNLAQQLESYRAMKVGNIAPDILFQEQGYVNGRYQNKLNSLSQVRTTYILLVFGASWCPNCQMDFQSLLGKYKELNERYNLEVVYVSLDTDKKTFESYYKEAPFITFCDTNGWETKAAKDYYVFATPTYLLLDKNLKILSRINSLEHLEAWLQYRPDKLN